MTVRVFVSVRYTVTGVVFVHVERPQGSVVVWYSVYGACSVYVSVSSYGSWYDSWTASSAVYGTCSVQSRLS